MIFKAPVSDLKGPRHGIWSYFWPSKNLPLNYRKPENNTLNHKGTRLVKAKIDTDYKQRN